MTLPLPLPWLEIDLPIWYSPVPPLSIPRKKASKCILREAWRTCPRGKTATGRGAPPLPYEYRPALLPFMQHSVHKEESGLAVVVACRLPVPMAAPVAWVAFWAVRPAERGREGRRGMDPYFADSTIE